MDVANAPLMIVVTPCSSRIDVQLLYQDIPKDGDDELDNDDDDDEDDDYYKTQPGRSMHLYTFIVHDFVIF